MRAMPPGDQISIPEDQRLPSLLWPLGVLMASLVAIIVALLLFAADEKNQLALKSSLHLASSALQSEIKALRTSARDYATWNDAVENLVVTLNEGWADENIGTWAYESLQIDATLLLDGQDSPRFAMIEGVRLGDDALDHFSDGLAPLVAAARQAEPGSVGTAVTGYVVVDGQLALGAAAPVIWEDLRRATERGGDSSVLVFLLKLDAAKLAELSESFLLPNLHISKSEENLKSAALRLASHDGTKLGYLTWKVERPGFLMLKSLILPGSIAGVVTLLLLIVVTNRATAAVRHIEASHAALQRQTEALSIARDQAEEQHRTEAELRRNAVAANRSKSEFLALMSHELRTPLNAILGFSETIAKQTFGSSATERYREYAEDIHESGTHLLSIINDILDLSKVEAGRYELHEEVVDLGSSLRRCTALLQERAGNKNLRLTCTAADFQVRADARAFKQIAINLLSNAIKYTPAGGRIELGTSLVAEGLEIYVRDSGIGMTEEELASALQPFGRAGSVLTRSIEGSGLGLNVVQELVRLHGGQMKILSTPGVGTTVNVSLPRSRIIASRDDLPPALSA